MIEVTGIDHVVFRVRDLERMERFYCDVLGLAVEKRNEPMRMLHLRAGRSLIDLIDVEGPLGKMGGGPPGPENRNVDHICLQVRDFDLARAQAHLKAHDIEPGPDGVRFGAGGDGVSLYLSDPEGNGLELRGAYEKE